MTSIVSINPRTAAVEETVTEATTAEAVDAAVELAASAAPRWERLGRAGRARVLRAIADALEARREDIVATGVRETALAEVRLNGELTRTCYQARLFAEVLDEGSYVEATIDHAGETPMGPGPDLRRMLVSLGPVAVFGASNFPLAFSVPGGDTVSALAAGCPVVVKAHDSHPALSLLTFDIMRAAALDAGAPDGTLGIVFGLEAGARLVQAPSISAVGFTGSLGGGRALLDLVNARPDPIPFFGELSSINPVIISPGALVARSAEVATGLVTSVTGSAGQLCTKPGVVLVPRGADGDDFVARVVAAIEEQEAFLLLNQGIATNYRTSLEGLIGADRTTTHVGSSGDGTGFSVAAAIVEVDLDGLVRDGADETFGPLAVVVRYGDADLDLALRSIDGSLTVTVHSEDDEIDFLRRVLDVGTPRAGRLIRNGWPTGVLVSWAQTHGGPWPSTNSQHTSVGATAIRRFLRPVTWQSMPDAVLPEELKDACSAIPRRVDGRLVPAVSD